MFAIDNRYRHSPSLRFTAVALVLIAAASLGGLAESSPDVGTYFQQYIGLSPDQIVSIRSGKPVTKVLPSRSPDEVFLFGAVYIHAAPESYVKFAHDYNRLSRLPSNLALGVFSDPPQLKDLQGFTFDNDDINALKNCKPGNCLIQMPASSIQELHESINWSAADVGNQVNQGLQKAALQLLLAYQKDGNEALSTYNDKDRPTEVPKRFAYMLSNSKALPAYLPDYYQYLLTYPKAKPENVANGFYWAKVKFGLKPTLRIVHVITMKGASSDPIAYVIAEKQLYSSHYFETALDLSFCVRGADDTKQPGFYLIMLMGSEQAGLTGVKGSIVRRTAVGRSVSNLQNALTTIKNAMEAK
jgi:hypothetical protein